MNEQQKVALRQALRILGRTDDRSYGARCDQIFGILYLAIPLNADSADLSKVRIASTHLKMEEVRGKLQ